MQDVSECSFSSMVVPQYFLYVRSFAVDCCLDFVVASRLCLNLEITSSERFNRRFDCSSFRNILTSIWDTVLCCDGICCALLSHIADIQYRNIADIQYRNVADIQYGYASEEQLQKPTSSVSVEKLSESSETLYNLHKANSSSVTKSNFIIWCLIITMLYTFNINHSFVGHSLKDCLQQP